MDGESILYLKRTPIDYHWGRKLQVPSDYVLHKFPTVEEAFLTLYTHNIKELNGLSAINEKRTYYLEEAGIYSNMKNAPLIKLKKFYNEGIDPATRLQNIDCLYTLSGHFDFIAQDTRKLFGGQINRKKFGIVELARYSVKDKTITSLNPNLQQAANAILNEKYDLQSSYDFAQINFQMRNTPPIAPNAVVTNMVRTRDFNTAFKHLVEQHFALNLASRPSDPDIEEQQSVILSACDSRPVANLQFATKYDSPKDILPGLYLHFEDKNLLKELLTNRPVLLPLTTMKADSIRLGSLADGLSCGFATSPEILSSMRSDIDVARKNANKQSKRKADNKNNRPRL